MKPIDAVSELAAVLLANPDTSGEEIYVALIRRGFTFSIADRTFKFTQIAWGRIFLDGLGITFPDQYYCLDAHGRVIEEGKLTDEPYFQAAYRLAGEYIGTHVFERLALTSADLHVINEALKAGSKPENLVTAPPQIFLAKPTPEGLRAADVAMEKGLRKIYAKKPWWKFWE